MAKITQPETITFTREKETGIECDMCHKHSVIISHAGFVPITDNWATEKGRINKGCEVRSYRGYTMDMCGPKIRTSELCTDCADKVLDWIESQGGTTYTEHR